jgi:hypothetical protein
MAAEQNGGGKMDKSALGGIEKQADQDTIYFKLAGHIHGHEEQH